MSSNASRFGQIVQARRRALNDLTQLDVYDRGGPSNSTLTAIEGGQWKRNSATFRKLDAALEWEPGSARRVFDEGGVPVPIAVPRPKPAATAGGLTDDELLAELTYRVKRYAALDAKGSDGDGRESAPTSAAVGATADQRKIVTSKGKSVGRGPRTESAQPPRGDPQHQVRP